MYFEGKSVSFVVRERWTQNPDYVFSSGALFVP